MIASGTYNSRKRGHFCGFRVGYVSIESCCHLTAAPGDTGAVDGSHVSGCFIKAVKRSGKAGGLKFRDSAVLSMEERSSCVLPLVFVWIGCFG